LGYSAESCSERGKTRGERNGWILHKNLAERGGGGEKTRPGVCEGGPRYRWSWS
jgi:hypothetical protein